MSIDRERWNKKYSEGFIGEKEPSEIVVKYYNLSQIGNALDIAAGLGRNSLFLAERGFKVDAIDVSDFAVEKLKSLHPNINPIHADLKSYRPEAEKYELIININFLERTLFPYIIEALKPKGVLIFETFLEGSPSKSSRDFLLRQNELLYAFLQLNIIYYEEKDVYTCKGEQARKAYLVAQKRC
ncbi:MAG: class I SAM-dependent methyltransferase [Hydrogenothermaceae bacterium]|nr:class I SAM-dependent methyltransferase [Hydrogenothermaceae bacterium]